MESCRELNKNHFSDWNFPQHFNSPILWLMFFAIDAATDADAATYVSKLTYSSLNQHQINFPKQIFVLNSWSADKICADKRCDLLQKPIGPIIKSESKFSMNFRNCRSRRITQRCPSTLSNQKNLTNTNIRAFSVIITPRQTSALTTRLSSGGLNFAKTSQHIFDQNMPFSALNPFLKAPPYSSVTVMTGHLTSYGYIFVSLFYKKCCLPRY